MVGSLVADQAATGRIDTGADSQLTGLTSRECMSSWGCLVQGLLEYSTVNIATAVVARTDFVAWVVVALQIVPEALLDQGRIAWRVPAAESMESRLNFRGVRKLVERRKILTDPGP